MTSSASYSCWSSSIFSISACFTCLRFVQQCYKLIIHNVKMSITYVLFNTSKRIRNKKQRVKLNLHCQWLETRCLQHIWHPFHNSIVKGCLKELQAWYLSCDSKIDTIQSSSTLGLSILQNMHGRFHPSFCTLGSHKFVYAKIFLYYKI